MKQTLLSIFASMLLFACSEDSNYMSIPLSSFDIQNELLEDKKLVKVLSFSGMPDLNPNVDYYIHMIIVSIEANDTFNLLTIAPAGILEDADKEMNFFSQNSLMYETMLNNLREENNGHNQGPIEKVIIDKNFEADTKNNYPTVIGIIGTYHQR